MKMIFHSNGPQPEVRVFCLTGMTKFYANNGGHILLSQKYAIISRQNNFSRLVE